MLSPLFSKQRYAAALGVFSIFPTVVAYAADWEVVRSISAAETYTDNVRLASDNEDKQSDLVTQIEPGIVVKGTGRHGVASLNYSAQGRIYKEQESSNRIDHRLLSSAKVVLLPKHVFLDATGTISQELISPNGQLALQNIASTENKSTVTTASISPYLLMPLGNNTRAELRYKHGEVIYEKETLADAQSDEGTMAINGDLFSEQMLWSLLYQNSRIGYANSDIDQISQIASAGLRYSITSTVSGYGEVGYEERGGINWPGQDSPSGKTWKLGMAWNPSETTTLEADYGRRFFGVTKGLKLTYTAPHSSWHATYLEELSTQQQLQFERANAALRSDSANLSAPQESIQFVASTVANVFVRRSATLGYNVKTAKTETGLGAFHEKRDFEDESKEETVRGITASWGWFFLPRTKLMLSGGWQQAMDKAETFHNMVHYHEIALTREIRPKLQGALISRRNQQNNAMDDGSYVETLLTAKLTYLF